MSPDRNSPISNWCDTYGHWRKYAAAMPPPWAPLAWWPAHATMWYLPVLVCNHSPLLCCSPRPVYHAPTLSIILLFYRLWRAGNVLGSFASAIGSCWFSLRFLMILDNRIPVRVTETWNRHCIRHVLVRLLSRLDLSANTHNKKVEKN